MDIYVPKYEVANGFVFEWNEGFYIQCEYDDYNTIVIKANTEGLISLARHLLEMSQADVPIGTHIHLDEYNSLSAGSNEIIIEKL